MSLRSLDTELQSNEKFHTTEINNNFQQKSDNYSPTKFPCNMQLFALKIVEVQKEP